MLTVQDKSSGGTEAAIYCQEERQSRNGMNFSAVQAAAWGGGTMRNDSMLKRGHAVLSFPL